MTKAEQVLVTGASGFVASHCIIQLLDKGYRVRGTLREMERADSMRRIIEGHTGKNADFEFVYADLMEDASWGQAVEGCSRVLHLASPMPARVPKDPKEFILPARDGTLRVLRAARDHGVKRTVVTSSMVAVSYGQVGRDNADFTEDDWTDPDSSDISAYVRSKTLAERAAWDFANDEGKQLELVVINPGAVLGPVLENDYGSSVELIRRLLKGDFPGCPSLGWPLVDVRDVAALHIAAMEAPEADGHRFLGANEFMWVRDIAQVLYEYVPDYRSRIPRRTLPDWLMRAFSLFDRRLGWVRYELGQRRSVSSRKAREMLGWKPRSNIEAIVAAAETLIALEIV